MDKKQGSHELVPYKLEGHHGKVNHVAIHPSKPILASAGADSDIRLWDLETFKLLKVLKGHVDAVNCLCFESSSLNTLSKYDFLFKPNLFAYKQSLVPRI